MAITLIVSSLAICAQIAFLFVVTYDSVSPEIALVAYLLTEIIPGITLILTLRVFIFFYFFFKKFLIRFYSLHQRELWKKQSTNLPPLQQQTKLVLVPPLLLLWNYNHRILSDLCNIYLVNKTTIVNY